MISTEIHGLFSATLNHLAEAPSIAVDETLYRRLPCMTIVAICCSLFSGWKDGYGQREMPKGTRNAVIYKYPRSFTCRGTMKKEEREINRDFRCETIQKPVIGSMRATSKALLRQHGSVARARRIITSWIVIRFHAQTKFRIKASAAHERPHQQRNFRVNIWDGIFAQFSLYHAETRRSGELRGMFYER